MLKNTVQAGSEVVQSYIELLQQKVKVFARWQALVNVGQSFHIVNELRLATCHSYHKGTELYLISKFTGLNIIISTGRKRRWMYESELTLSL